MATFSNILVIFVISVVVLLPTTTLATEYLVGDLSGWRAEIDYQNWAKDKQFYVGDTLVFKYLQGSANVYMVNANAYASCIAPDDVKPLTSGHDVVNLTTPGKKWYICGLWLGSEHHCEDSNQKLAINVQERLVAPEPAPNSVAKYGYQSFTLLSVIILSFIVMF